MTNVNWDETRKRIEIETLTKPIFFSFGLFYPTLFFVVFFYWLQNGRQIKKVGEACVVFHVGRRRISFYFFIFISFIIFFVEKKMISTDRRVSLVDSLERRFFFKRARSRFTTTANLVSTRFPRLDRVPSLVPWLYLGLLGFTEFYRVLPSFT